jgi:hemolysin activation/secretion protein
VGVIVRQSVLLSSLVSTVLTVAAVTAAVAQTAPQVTPGAAQPLPTAPVGVSRPVNESVLTVPPVIERPIEDDAGPRIIVTRFVIDGAADHAANGVTVSGLQQILDQSLKTQPAEGYTVNQLQKIAGGVATAYRAKGYVLSQSFIPAQDVHNGEVHVQVLEGRLGAIRVEGNKRFSAKTLAGPFSSDLHQAVNQDDVEARLLRLSDYAGLSVFGVFTPGRDVGDSDLVLKVQREKALDFELGGDNYGSIYSGEYRGHAGLAWNSPFGAGDRLSLSFLKASSSSVAKGADTKYYSGDYRLPVGGGRGALTLAVNNNDYAVGGPLAGLFSGRGRVGTAGFEWETSRSRLGRSYFYVHADTKKGEFTTSSGTSAGDIVAEEKLTDGEVGFVLDRSDRSGKGRWNVSVALLHGSNSVEAQVPPDPTKPQPIRPESDSSYTVGRIGIERMQSVTRFSTLRLKLGAQVTSNVLPTLEESALGGPNTVRAYDVANFVGDKSATGTLEYFIGAPGFAAKPGPGGQPWGQTFQFVLFGDYGRGWVNGTGTSGVSSERDLKGAGVGLAFNLPHRFSFRVDGAKALSATAQDRANRNFKDTRVYASFGLMF